jgi:hypothetical protein
VARWRFRESVVPRYFSILIHCQHAKGDKALIGNTGFRRYLKTISDEHFAIDADKIQEEKKFDGIFVLRTSHCWQPPTTAVRGGVRNKVAPGATRFFRLGDGQQHCDDRSVLNDKQ